MDRPEASGMVHFRSSSEHGRPKSDSLRNGASGLGFGMAQRGWHRYATRHRSINLQGEASLRLHLSGPNLVEVGSKLRGPTWAGSKPVLGSSGPMSVDLEPRLVEHNSIRAKLGRIRDKLGPPRGVASRIYDRHDRAHQMWLLKAPILDLILNGACSCIPRGGDDVPDGGCVVGFGKLLRGHGVGERLRGPNGKEPQETLARRPFRGGQPSPQTTNWRSRQIDG